MGKKLVLKPVQAAPKESTLGYLGRNIAKAPFTIASDVLGFPGDIAQTMQEEGLYDPPKGLPPAYAKLGLDKFPLSPITSTLRNLLPTSQYIREKLPTYLGESKPEDWVPETISRAAPFFMGKGALSFPGLVKGAFTAGGAHLGGYLGGKAGSAIGEEFGIPKTGQLLGGFGGGYAGIKGGQKAYGYAANIPTRKLPKLVEKKLEAGKSKIARQRETVLGDIEKHKTSADTHYANLETALNEIPGGDVQLDATSLIKNINKVVDKVTSGVLKAEKSNIYDLVGNIAEDIVDNKISFNKARQISENLGDLVYERGASGTTKKSANLLRNEIKKAIGSGLEQYPEIKGYWEDAQSTYSKYKELQKQSPKTLKKLDIEEKNLFKKTAADSSAEKVLEKIGKTVGRYGPTATGSYIAHLIGDALGFPSWGKRLLTLGGSAAGEGLKQWKTVRNVMKKHPDIHADWKSAVKSAQKGNPADLVKIIPIIDSYVEQPITGKEEGKKLRLRKVE